MHIGVAGGYENLITSLKKIMFVLKNISYYMVLLLFCNTPFEYLRRNSIKWLSKILDNFSTSDSYHTYSKFSPYVKSEIALLKIVMARDNKLNIELNGLYKQ